MLLNPMEKIHGRDQLIALNSKFEQDIPVTEGSQKKNTSKMSEFSDWQNLLDSRTKEVVSEGKLRDFFLIRNDNSKRVQTILEDRVSRFDYYNYCKS